MPPGYAAFFLWVAAAVLWWSGWREETAEGIPDGAVAVFLAGWPLTAWNNIPFWGGAEVNAAFMWTTLAMFALALRLPSMAGWTAVSAGLLTGSLAILLSFSPVLYWIAPNWASVIGIAIIAGLAAAVLVKGASGQMIAVSTALLLFECLSAAWLHTDQTLIGTGRWKESWWIAVLTARLAALSLSVAGSILDRRGWKREGEGT